MNENKTSFVKRDAIVSGKEYARLLGELKDRFRRSQIKAAVRVNSAMLEYYWEMGRDISRLYANAKYGSAFFDCLSLDLKAEFPGQTGFSATNIKYAKRWYEFYNQDNENLQRLVDDFKTDHSPNLHQAGEDFNDTVSSNRHQIGDDFEMPLDFGKVPWKHHVYIFTHSKSIAEALFYIDKTIENGWSRAELEAEIDDNLYAKQGRVVTSFDDDNPTIGLLICKSKDDTVVEWSLRGMNQPLGVAEYKLISEKVARLLPSESDLERIIDTYSSNLDNND